MVKVIVINGAGTSGKDTFIDLFTEVCREVCLDYKVYRFSSVDMVKYHACCMGWDCVKDDKGRQFLSDIKDAMTKYNDGPYKYMKEKVDEIKEATFDEDTAFVFFHVREPQEIAKMKERLNATTLLIKRPSVDPESFTNHADKNVQMFDYDYRVLNNGTLDDLKHSALFFLDYLLC